jgi:hypothetical protein
LNAAVRIHHAFILDPAHRESVLSALFLARLFVSLICSPLLDSQAEVPAQTFSLVDAHSAMQQLVSSFGFISRHVRNVAMDLPGLAHFGAQWIGGRYLADRKIPYIALRNMDGVYALNLYGEQAPTLTAA